MLEFERKYWSQGVQYIAGIDEAGRGPLAGPVVVASVILPQDVNLPGVTDSKKISEKKRERLYDDIKNTAISIGIGISYENEIDRINILQATYQSMRRSLGKLSIKPDIILVDGNKADIKHYKQESIVNGDLKSLSIAAASIIAKVTRDRMMRQFDIIFPEYNFAKHKGYGTKQHLEAIKINKSTPIHRKSFNPITKYLPNMAYLKKHCLLERLGIQLIACELIRKNNIILEINYIKPGIGAIDIIVKDKNKIVFIDVQTQDSNILDKTFEDNSSPNNKDNIDKLIQNYMELFKIDFSVRYDMANIILGCGKPKISFIPNFYVFSK